MSRRRGRGRGNSAPAAGVAAVASSDAQNSAPAPGVAAVASSDAQPMPSEGGAVAPVSAQIAMPAVQPRAAAPRNNPPVSSRPPRSAAPAQPQASVPVADATDGDRPEGHKSTCTLAQMRRFIKSRPYVPVHELRRRFLIEGIEDEVSPMPTSSSPLYVGLPPREAGFLGELVKAGEVGCELLLDPTSPAIIGVFPMRPVARQ
ncbi:MAG TPA: hypothetical protein VF375_09130 [Candidatus Limnocylindrales bacterium]